MIIALLIIAAIPWALALPVLRWHPGLQTPEARSTYRKFTAVVCLVISAVALLIPPLWLIPVGMAIWLDVLWFYRSHTRRGRALLGFAKVH
jgi:uncharacterized membrane protein YccC